MILTYILVSYRRCCSDQCPKANAGVYCKLALLYSAKVYATLVRWILHVYITSLWHILQHLLRQKVNQQFVYTKKPHQISICWFHVNMLVTLTRSLDMCLCLMSIQSVHSTLTVMGHNWMCQKRGGWINLIKCIQSEPPESVIS